jgi:sarcosine oxidase subunit beta
LKGLLVIQKKHGLNIDWLDEDEMVKLLPGINAQGLRGGTYSPEDANLSPLMAGQAFYKQAKKQGVAFKFLEKVIEVRKKDGPGVEVRTDKATYVAEKVINAAGANAREVGKLMGVDLPVFPDSHEGGVTEPVKQFFNPMLVDLREFPGSKNFYFYQEVEGHIVFCLTPQPIIPGVNRDSTSEFLPQAARRLIQVFPRLRNIRVRRVWRGLYPMTPDGVPIVDQVRESDGLYLAVGFCGQGLMLGPGIALNLVSLITKGKPVLPEDVFESYSLYRDYSRPSEALK